MANKLPLSVVIVTKNEEDNLEDCLKSIYAWVEEIIIIDDQSTDKTLEIAQRYTDKIFIRKWDLEGKQRNWGAGQAKNTWVMMLDADERMNIELRREMEEVLSQNDGKTVAYWIPRKNYFGNKWLRYGGWYPAPHIKLYKKDFLRWREVVHDVVHPGVDIREGFCISQLKNHLIHYNFKNVEDFIKKVNRQSTLEAIKWHLQGKKISLIHGLWKSFDRFYRRYVYKKGYKDGYYGFVAAVLSGFYQLAAYSKLREIKEKGAYLKENRIKKVQ
jgi:glycosyltransferase involved in cell wall biosynthesis